MEGSPVYWQGGAVIAGRYRLLNLLGRGGVGEVWLAEDVSLQRQVAIKTLLPTLSQQEFIDRFGVEARVIAQLNHPNIVQVFDTGREEENRYIVMEYVRGRDLGSTLKLGLPPLGSALKISVQVTSALQYAHGKGVLHRDLKPSNILIDDENGNAKLTDFGLAKNVLENAPTLVGFAGTPQYASPEQLVAKRLDNRSDIYSLGVTLYQLFTGSLPFSDPDLAKLVELKATSRPKDPQIIKLALPRELCDAILRMLEPDRDLRCQSLSEVLPTLEKLAAENPVIADPTVGTYPPIGAVPETQPTGTVVSQLKEGHAPTGFFNTEVFPKTQFFKDEAARFTKIQETLQFYRDHLNGEYKSLLQQANTTYKLWLCCVLLGFLVLIAGVVAMLAGFIGQGIATAASTIIVFFIQKIFQQREDHYRDLARAKNGHLEYGNQWLLVIQSIDSIIDIEQRKRRQEKLVDVLTAKLSESSQVTAKPRVTKRKKGKAKA